MSNQLSKVVAEMRSACSTVGCGGRHGYCDLHQWADRIEQAIESAAALPAVPEVPKDAPLTATALAEALSCFWNAAIGSQSVQYDPTARAVAGAMAEGLAAVEHRLRELAATSTRTGHE